MRKLFFTIAVLLCSVNAFGQYSYKDFFKNNVIGLDCTYNFGAGYCYKPSARFLGTDITIKNFMFGSGVKSVYIIDEIIEDDNWDKPVHVKGYYRKDGTYVHSYYRAKPGQAHPRTIKKGHRERVGGDIYIGYWLPIPDDYGNAIYAAPIIGYTSDADNGLLYGGGIKFYFGYLGGTICFTNTSLTFGLSLRIF